MGKIIGGIFAFGICWFGILFLLCIGIPILRNHLIPGDVILSNPTHLANFLMFVPSFFLSFFIVIMLFGWCVLDLKGYFFKGTMKVSINATIVSLIILFIFGLFNYFYVTPEGITFRPLFFQKEVHYDWSDIVKVHGLYRQQWTSKGENYTFAYVLCMKDGKEFNLVNDDGSFIDQVPPTFFGAYDKIKPFIRAQPQISYDHIIEDDGSFQNYTYTEAYKKFIKIIKNED